MGDSELYVHKTLLIPDRILAPHRLEALRIGVMGQTELRNDGVLRSSPVSIPHTAVNREWSRGFDPLAGSSPWRSYDLYVVFLRKSLSEAHGGLRVVSGSRQTLRQFL